MAMFSTAELSYLRDSLKSQPPIRPDGRSATQFRPLEASTGFLPTANGSARVRTADGAECIVGIKAKVAREPIQSELINVDVDIAGTRDDHPLPHLLGRTFKSALDTSSSLTAALKISSKYSFKLFIDGMVLSHSSHPLGILSFAIYLALKSARLPLLISSTNDEDAEEVPMFHDDWNESQLLCSPELSWDPPVLFLCAVVGQNILIDPIISEEKVAETGVIMGYSRGKIVAPIKTVDLDSEGSPNNGGIEMAILNKVIKMLVECGPEVVEALDQVVATDSEEGSIFV